MVGWQRLATALRCASDATYNVLTMVNNDALLFDDWERVELFLQITVANRNGEAWARCKIVLKPREACRVVEEAAT